MYSSPYIGFIFFDNEFKTCLEKLLTLSKLLSISARQILFIFLRNLLLEVALLDAVRVPNLDFGKSNFMPHFS
jgi:hypothetical protein